MQAEFENMMKELSNAAGLGDLASLGLPTAPANAASQPAASASSSKAAPTVAAEESFQETIKKTMERMQASGEQATAAAAADDTDDILAELMKQMQSTGLDGESNEEDFSKMLLGMMEQLTNKDILYEPMKELHDKFPTWMEKNKDTVPKEDLKRYEEQQRVVAEIVAKFEEPTYKDENAKDREYIVERMQLVSQRRYYVD
jgi:peroxin-19